MLPAVADIFRCKSWLRKSTAIGYKAFCHRRSVPMGHTEGYYILPKFLLLAPLLNINGACQYCITDKTEGKSYLLATWPQTKSAC